MMHRLSFILVCLCALGLGCSSNTNKTGTDNASADGSNSGASTNSTPSAAADGSRPLRIAVIPKGTSHEFWKSVHAGAENAAMEFGNVEVVWKGPFRENDRDGQISVVQDFVTQKVDGIILAPLDQQALIPYVRE